MGDKVVHIVILEWCARIAAEKKDSGQCLIQIQAEDLPECRESPRLGAVEHFADLAEFLRVVDPAQDAVIENGCNRLAWLALHETPEILLGGGGKSRAFNQQDLLAGGNVAIKVDTIVGDVDAEYRAHKQLFADTDGKRIVGKLVVQFIGRAMEHVAKCLNQGDSLPMAVDDAADEAFFCGSMENVERFSRGLEILAFEHAKTCSPAHFHQGDEGVVFVLAMSVMNPGVFEIQFATGRPPDEETRESARVVECFHEKRFRSRQTIKQHISKGIPIVDRECRVDCLYRPGNTCQAFLDGHFGTALAQIFTAKRNGNELGAFNEVGSETLQYDIVPTFPRGAIQAVAVAVTAQLARRGAHQQCGGRKAFADGSGQSLDVEVGGYISKNHYRRKVYRRKLGAKLG